MSNLDISEIWAISVLQIRTFIDGFEPFMKHHPLLNYFFNLAKVLLLFELSIDLCTGAAAFRSLIFTSKYFLTTLSASVGIKALSSQIFWILVAHVQRKHFTSNVIMSLIMILDADLQLLQNELLALHLILHVFQILTAEKDIVCIVVCISVALVWYSRWCENKSLSDVLLVVILYFASWAWYPHMPIIPTVLILTSWVSYMFLKL